MTFDDVVAGQTIFVDANIFTYHFQPHPQFGAACTRILQRIENQEIQGVTAIHFIGETSHRLMTIEARQGPGLAVRWDWQSTTNQSPRSQLRTGIYGIGIEDEA